MRRRTLALWTIAFLPVGLVWLDAAHGDDRGRSSASTASSQPSAEPTVLGPDFFPLMPWDPIHGWTEPHLEPANGLESIAACGFTMAGFVHASDLPLCEKLGLKAIIAPPAGEKPWFGPWRDLSDDEIDARVRAMVESAGDSPALAGFFITDEPGTPLFTALGKAVAAVDKYAPGKLAYINLFPSYATVGAADQSQLGADSFTEYLERFVNEVRPRFLSYDNYMVQYSDDLQVKGPADNYFFDLMEVRRVAMKYNLPFWNIVSANQIRNDTPPPSPANMMLQAYTTLAAGGRGLSWYTYYGGGYAYAPIDKDGGKTATWHALRMVNQHASTLGLILNRQTSTGVYAKPPGRMMPSLPGRLVRDVVSRASRQRQTDTDVPIMIGEFSGEDGTDCVMLVNLSVERTVNVMLQTSQTYKHKLRFSPDDGRVQPLDDEHGLWLPAGQGVLIKLVR
ncbi:MAG: hypothetical protein JW741_11785 [Sedimentisphaerales bacterium]|nr:hypothetical protein [Sedimentisphaerales bacterium]